MGEAIGRRRRDRLGQVDEPCGLCGKQGLDLIESRRIRRIPWLGHRNVHRYKLCPACGARHVLEVGGQPAG